MTGDLTPEQQGALAALRSSRGPCPSGETLVEYQALDERARAQHASHDHISICSRCQLVVLHVAEPRSGVTMRWALPFAAMLVLAAGVTLLRPDFTSNAPPDTVRGTELLAVSPIGASEQLREFTWQSPIVADRYRVTVRRGTTVIWQAETPALRVAPPPSGTIDRDVQYEWQVEALDREGHVRMTSPSQSFVVY